MDTIGPSPKTHQRKKLTRKQIQQMIHNMSRVHKVKELAQTYEKLEMEQLTPIEELLTDQKA